MVTSLTYNPEIGTEASVGEFDSPFTDFFVVPLEHLIPRSLLIKNNSIKYESTL